MNTLLKKNVAYFHDCSEIPSNDYWAVFSEDVVIRRYDRVLRDIRWIIIEFDDDGIMIIQLRELYYTETNRINYERTFS